MASLCDDNTMREMQLLEMKKKMMTKTKKRLNHIPPAQVQTPLSAPVLLRPFFLSECV